LCAAFGGVRDSGAIVSGEVLEEICLSRSFAGAKIYADGLTEAAAHVLRLGGAILMADAQ
jgi:hypothetical protein